MQRVSPLRLPTDPSARREAESGALGETVLWLRDILGSILGAPELFAPLGDLAEPL